jgi:hypothetical protein
LFSAAIPNRAALIYHRSAAGFPKVPLPDTSKKWQETFFYMKNVNPEEDLINLPPFVNVVLTRQNWGFVLGTDHFEANTVAAQTAAWEPSQSDRCRFDCHIHALLGAPPRQPFAQDRPDE